MSNTFIPIPIESVQEAQEAPSLTYKLDLDRGRIVGMVDGQEAVAQAIRKAIITPRFKCLIYDNQYGSEIEEALIAQDATQEYVEAVVEGFIKDALKPDTRILDITDFAISFEDDAAHISFTAVTIFGPTEISEVI